MIDYQSIDNTWTLFLDRDGVIVEENEGTYLTDPADVKLMPEAGEVIHSLNSIFYKIIEVTNQKCIGLGILSKSGFHEVQDEIAKQLAEKDARLDKCYYAPGLDLSDPLRKPNTGMAIMAKEDFPEIDFEKSIMIGNNLSDMEFGKKMGMHTIFISTTKPKFSDLSNEPIDEQYDDLKDWYGHVAPRFDLTY